MNTHAQSYWQRRFAADKNLLEEQRELALQQIRLAAVALRERWPLIKSIWVFGSVLGEGFHEESDIDLMVEGLPPQDLLGAIKLAETDACRSVDLKRAEDISAELRFRLLRISEALVAAALRLHSFYTAVAALMASNCAARLVPTTCEVPRRF